MKSKSMIVSAGLFICGVSYAGGGHFHPKQVAKCSGECSETQIKAALPEAIPHLNKWGRIESEWAKAKVEKVEKKQFKKGPEWMLTLQNDAGQRRYVFMTLDGYVTGANSTGE